MRRRFTRSTASSRGRSCNTALASRSSRPLRRRSRLRGRQRPHGGGGSTSSGPNAATAAASPAAACCDFVGSRPATKTARRARRIACDKACNETLGCVDCAPGGTGCVGNEVHECADDRHHDGRPRRNVRRRRGYTCSNGRCKTGCEVADDQPSKVGCEFGGRRPRPADGFRTRPRPIGRHAFETPAASLPTSHRDQHRAGGAAVGARSGRTAIGATGRARRDHHCPSRARAAQCRTNTTRPAPAVVAGVPYHLVLAISSTSSTCSRTRTERRLAALPRAPRSDVPRDRLGRWVTPSTSVSRGRVDRSYITVVGTEPGTQVTVHPSWKIKGTLDRRDRAGG